MLQLVRSPKSPLPVLSPPDPRLGLTPRPEASAKGWAPTAGKDAAHSFSPKPLILPASCSPCNLASAPSPIISTAAITTTLHSHVSAAPHTSAASSETEAALRARVLELEAQLAATKSPAVPQPIPPPIKEITGGVPHILRIWRAVIQPQEQKGNGWRSAEKLGEKESHKLEQSLSAYHYPILRAVMQRYPDDGMSLDDAVADVEELRGSTDLSKFATSLPKHDADAKRRYKTALLALTPSPPSRSSPQPAPKSFDLPPLTDHPPSAAIPECAIPTIDGAIRYLGFDPSLSCGWAILQVREGVVVSVAVGAIQVDGADVGARCNDLKRAIQPLLIPAPAYVLVESFHGHGRAVDAISYHLRSVIAMETNSSGISLTELAPQSWKSAIGVSGGEADKAVIKTKLESTFNANFPAKIPNVSSGRAIKFKTDASDAAGIALAGAMQQHASISFAPQLAISAPAIGEKRGSEGSASSIGKKAKH